MKKKHKQYLREKNLNSIDKLIVFIEAQKILRNQQLLTGKDLNMFFELIHLMVNNKEELESFFIEGVKSSIPEYSLGLPLTFHSSPFNTGDYCDKKERLKEVEKEERLGGQMKRGKIITYFEQPEIKALIGEENMKSFTWGYNNVELTSSETDYLLNSEKNKERLEESIQRNGVGSYVAENLKLNTTYTITSDGEKIGIKESQTVKKAPVFTYCKQMKNALEQLALRSLYGHEKYEKGDDWENFSRVPNAEFEYSNSMFRHALEIGGDEDELQHLVAQAWNSIAKLELHLRKLKNS